MIHEPSGFLRNADCPVNLVPAPAVCTVGYLPHCQQPLIQAQGGILKDRARLGSDLSKVVLAAAPPAVVLRLKQNLRANATGTPNTIRPTVRCQVLAAIVGACEVDNAS